VNEFLDIEQPGVLAAYLRATGRIAADERPRVTRLSGGVSNRTLLVERPAGEGWVVKQALPKLRVAVDWFSDPQRIEREALALRWLAELAPAGSVPALVFLDAERHILAMRAVPSPHENWKERLLAGRLVASEVFQFADWLAQVHRRASERREELAVEFADWSYFESLRLEPYYAYTAEQVPAAAAFLGQLIAATRRRRDTLVHGDYSPKNVLVHAGRLVLLDFEVAHFGDAAFDLGFSLAHLLSKGHYGTPAPWDVRAIGNWRPPCWPTPRSPVQWDVIATGFWRRYCQKLGDVPWIDGLEQRVVRHTLACLLARVAGRSPLEYLDASARRRQQAVVLKLIARKPRRVQHLISDFLRKVTVRRADP
jgi:aminoglycoside phosphotransferase (APT) family kinase protein